MHEKLRNRLLIWWAGVVSRHPVWVLLVASALAAASVYVTVLPVRLGSLSLGPLVFQGNRNDLISKNIDWNQRFISWVNNFQGSGDIIVAVDVGIAREQAGYEDRLVTAKKMVDRLAVALQAQAEHVKGVVWGFQESEFSPRALRLLDGPEFEAQLEEVTQIKPLLEAPTLAELLRTDRPRAGPPDPRELIELSRLVDAITAVLRDPMNHRLDLEAQMAEAPAATQPGAGFEYLLSENGRMLFMRVTPRVDPNELNSYEPAVDAVREVVADIGPQFPHFEAGVTGIDVVETDETRVATFDATWTSFVAFTLILGLLIVAYQSIRAPLIAMVSLLYGIAWAYGFTTLAVGHLQVLSVVFTVMLMGLGIAYGIYLQSRYELVRRDYPDTPEGFEAAMRDALLIMGPGIMTGAVTTAAAFATTLFTKFKGVAEMGLIAGVGILLCLMAMFSVFPALLRLLRWRHQHVVPMQDRFVHFFEERWAMPFVNHARLTIVIAGLVLALSVLAVTQMRFNYDLMELQPRGIESVQWEDRIVRYSGESIWTGVSIIDPKDYPDPFAEARRRKKKFLERDTVLEVRGIGLLFPDDEAEKIRRLNTVRAELFPEVGDTRPGDTSPAATRPAATAPAVAPDVLGALTQIRKQLGLGQFFTPLAGLFGQAPSPELRQAMSRLQASIDRALATAEKLSPNDRALALENINRDYHNSRQRILDKIHALLDPAPLTPADFPRELLLPYIANDGRIALEISPNLKPPGRERAADSALSPGYLPHFIRDMESVDPLVTGVVVQIYRSGSLIKNSYFLAGGLSLVVVLTFVGLDFRSLANATLALLPVAFGFGVTFAIMWLSGMSINPANIIVLPLMFGIGVDSGVHMIYRRRMDPDGQPPGLTSGTGKGITITNLTSVIGFGALIAASHRGISSLGFVLTVGMALTMLACWIVMPAWMQLTAPRKQTS